MNDSKERDLFRDLLHRQIARVCADEALGAYAIARELGLPAKKVLSPLRTMHKAGVLECEGSDGAASKLYRLKPDLLDALLEAAAEARDPGLVRDGQMLLVVEADDPNLVLRALQPADIVGVLAWSARISGDGAVYLLAFEPGAGTLAVDSVLERLSSAGAAVRQMAVNEVIVVEELKERGKLMRQRKRSQSAEQTRPG
jgi:hypothetical protein